MTRSEFNSRLETIKTILIILCLVATLWSSCLGVKNTVRISVLDKKVDAWQEINHQNIDDQNKLIDMVKENSEAIYKLNHKVFQY